MKYLFFSLFLFIIIECYGQTNNSADNSIEDLKKYTYLIKSKSNGIDMPFGSCFFIKTDRNLFLASSAHVILQRDVYGNDKPFQPDSFFVRCCDGTMNNFCLAIDFSHYKSTSPRIATYKLADILLFKVTLPNGIKVNSIEKYIDYSEKYNSIPDSVFIFGFGDNALQGTPALNNTETATPNMQSGVVTDKMMGVYLSTYNYVDTTIYSTNALPTSGYSGAPVFIKYKALKYTIKKERILFGGIAKGVDLTYQMGRIVRPDIIITKLIKEDN